LTGIAKFLYYPKVERIPLISLVGPEGSGKSTQAKLLAKKLNLTYVSTRDMIRDATANDTGELGDACRTMHENHTYLPGYLLLKMVQNRLNKPDTEKGLVLDGGFRTLEETQGFPEMLKGVDRDFAIKVIFLRTPGWENIERLEKRERFDDTPEAILSRLSTFYDKLGERMKFIRNQWGLTIIMAANKGKEELSLEIAGKLS